MLQIVIYKKINFWEEYTPLCACVCVYMCVCVCLYMCFRLRLHLYVPRVGIAMPRLCHPNVRPFTAASILYTPPTTIYYPTQCVA